MCADEQIKCWLAFNDVWLCCCQHIINFKFFIFPKQNYVIQDIFFDFFIPYKRANLFLVSDENTDFLFKYIKS